MKQKTGGLVYSTGGGRMCPGCRSPLEQCNCKKGIASASGDGSIRVHRETKGRKGAGVTVITGIPLEPEALRALAKTLKQKCGSGGTVKDGTIEIQGDHQDLLVSELRKQGWSVCLGAGKSARK